MPVANKASCYADEILARKVALAHRGSTVEISSQLTDDLKIRSGDAILFVELDNISNDKEWQFAVDDEEVLAQV